jgi:HprK-related kinase A
VYGDYPLEEGRFADFDVTVVPPRNLRRWVRRQALFLVDGKPYFEPYPAALTMPLLEWGLNWCIGGLCHDHLLVHAAVLERGGRAVIMPARPGVGKSTLCAALAHRGWRLLSDEMALLRPGDGVLDPIPRPIGLKNESIDVIRAFVPEARFGPLWPGTVKGTIGHVRPPRDAIDRDTETALPGWVVFPAYRAGAPTRFEPHGTAEAFLRIADNAFNYQLLGETGFETLARVVDSCACYEFEYGDLDDAVRAFAEEADRA